MAVSLHVDEGVQIKQGQGKFPRRLRAQELDAKRFFAGIGGPSGDEAEGQFDLRCRLLARFTFQALGEGLRELIGGLAVEHLQSLESMRAALPTRTTRQGI